MSVLLEHFADLEDPRWDRYKLHKFSDLLFITICATLCGADGWEDIEDFAHAKIDWLKKYLELPNGIPSAGHGAEMTPSDGSSRGSTRRSSKPASVGGSIQLLNRPTVKGSRSMVKHCEVPG
jgi:hypothetical protein